MCIAVSTIYTLHCTVYNVHFMYIPLTCLHTNNTDIAITVVCSTSCIRYTPGVANLWPAGQKWPFSKKLWPFLTFQKTLVVLLTHRRKL